MKKYLDYLIPSALVIISTIIFRITELDLTIQNSFYQKINGWYLKDSQPWDFFYHFGNIPALILVVVSLIFLGLSFQFIKYIRFRKICIYIILVMLIGPGLITNTILKDNWGRPRPRNIAEFGGKYNYEEILTIDLESKGKSFPCGHATMGFFFFVLFFIFRRKNQLLSLGFLLFALTWGSLIGLARIIQGGHFTSDVIWAGFIIYLISLVFYDLLKLRRFLFYKVTEQTILNTAKYKILRLIISIGIIVLILIVAIATPYSSEKKYRLPDYNNSQFNSCKIDLSYKSADVDIFLADSCGFDFDIYGFGFPRSKIRNNFDHTLRDSILNLVFSQSISGIFSEITQHVKIYLPNSKKLDCRIFTSEGNMYFGDTQKAKGYIKKNNVKILRTSTNSKGNIETIEFELKKSPKGYLMLNTEDGKIVIGHNR